MLSAERRVAAESRRVAVNLGAILDFWDCLVVHEAAYVERWRFSETPRPNECAEVAFEARMAASLAKRASQPAKADATDTKLQSSSEGKRVRGLIYPRLFCERGGRVSHQGRSAEDQIWRERKGHAGQTSQCHSVGLNKLSQSIKCISWHSHIFDNACLHKVNFQSATTVQWAAVQWATVQWIHKNASPSHLINNTCKLRSIVSIVHRVYRVYRTLRLSSSRLTVGYIQYTATTTINQRQR